MTDTETTATPTPQIYTLLPLVMRDVHAVGKDGRNLDQKYAFRKVDDTIDAANAAMCKHGVSLSWSITDAKQFDITTAKGAVMSCTVLFITYRFTAPDGSMVMTQAIGEGRDSGDKSANKAMSAALKYALSHTLLIPTQDNSDPETSEPAPPDPAVELRQAKRELMHAIAVYRKGVPDGLSDVAWVQRVGQSVLGRLASSIEDVDAVAEAMGYYDAASGERMP